MKLTEKILAINKLKELAAQAHISDNDIYEEISHTAQVVTHSDRASLFIYNKQLNHLETYYAKGLPTKIEVLLGEGIAGSCALKKQILVENDVDTTKNFNASIDLGSGYVTTNTLAVPILDQEGALLGVLQVLNKEKLSYNEKDEQLLLKIVEIASAYL